MAQAIQKVCSVCGADVATRKRTKDSAGNYYCQPCYGSASLTASEGAEPQVDFAALESLAAASDEPSKPTPPPELFTCPLCNGMFVEAKMDVSGVCKDCVKPKRLKRDVRESAKPKGNGRRSLLAIAAAVATITGITLYVVVRNANEAKRAADERVQEAHQKLLEAAEREATVLRQAQAESARPTQRTQSRSELVDDDPVLRSLCRRGLDYELRSAGGSLANSRLRRAWTTKQISYEEYQYATKFLRSQHLYP